jgi:hypothetical protein
MNIVKPVYVYKWVNSKQPIKYVFVPAGAANDAANAAYSPSITVINEPIYQDSSKEDAMNKIAYYINNASGTAATAATAAVPYYAWVNDEPFLFNINNIKWKGYNINPFKSTDRKAGDINADIRKKDYEKSKELFETTDTNVVINIVFKTDFNEDIKYYYDNIKFKSNNYKVNSDRRINELYKVKIGNNNNNKKTSEEYYKVIFAANIADMPSLIILFDRLTASRKIQLIQYITNLNKAYYKLYKKHNFKNRKELSRIFKLTSDTTNKDRECINIYYTSSIFITIYATGIVNLTFKFHKDKGASIADILKHKDDLNNYINDVLNINIVFKEKFVNARIRYNVYKATTDNLKREIAASSIFTTANDKDGKGGVFYYYKRTANYKDRSVVDKVIKNDILNSGVANAVLTANTADILDALIIVKKESGGFMIDVKNTKSFFEFECLEYWISRIIESSINDKQSTEPEPIVKDAKKDAKDDASAASAASAAKVRSKSDDGSGNSSSDNIYKGLLNNYADGSSSGDALAAGAYDGGAPAKKGDADDNNFYLINKLQNADKDIWAKNNNPSRKCQKDHQPLPLTREEYNDLIKKGYKFDNSLNHNKNIYVCPRIWCPKSNVPLDEADPNAKCPLADEKPMLMNENMKNKNKPRYVYLKTKDNMPCCGKKANNNDAVNADAADIIPVVSPKQPPKPPNQPPKSPNQPPKSPNQPPKSPNQPPKSPNQPPKQPKSSPKQPPKPDNDNNHIMKKYPIDKINRYGDIPEELYKILYPNDYKDYLSKCSSPNNISKKRCILRKGLINIEEITHSGYDNIINTIAYLVGETKQTFIENIKNKLDILKYISLDNGNVCKDFGDYEPVLYEDNKGLYEELKVHIITKNLAIVLPDDTSSSKGSKGDASEYKISRLLYIYKSYRTFIEYLSADNYPEDKGVQYLYSLVALVYKRLLIVWEITINTNSNAPSVDLIAPDYASDIIEYYDGLQRKNTKGDIEILMILKEKWVINGSKEENKKYKDNKLYEIMKDRDSIYFYEPLVIKQINKAEKKHYTLSEFPNIAKIMNYKPANNILSNLKHIDKNMKDDTKVYRFAAIIINDNYTIDKMILENGVIIRFNPQGTLVLPYLIKELNIKNVVFADDIKDTAITTYNHIHAKFLENINKLKDFNITVDIGEITSVNNIMTESVIGLRSIRSIDSEAGRLLLFGKKGAFEEYKEKDAKDINKWSQLRLLVKDKLMSVLETKNNRMAEYSKKTRQEFIKYLVGLFDDGSRGSRIASGTPKIQIILEEIPVFTKNGLNDWYASTLLHTKYDYINGLSDNFVDNGSELLFTQFLVNKNIPKNILYYHDANPRIIQDASDAAIVNYDDTKAAKAPSAANAQFSPAAPVPTNIINIPSMFEGEPKVLNSKWIKYKKKIWWRLKYMKNVYSPNNIKELFNYLKVLDNDLVNDYSNIIEMSFNHFKNEFNKNKDGSADNKKRIKDVFKDPHFYTSYINAMNQVNNTKKVFKNVEMFLTNYFYNSTVDERKAILNHLRTASDDSNDTYIYHPNETTLFNMSKVLNISILIIHSRAEYGKAVDVSKRADDKDLSITTTIFKADGGSGSGSSSGDALNRPLVILYRHNDKTQLNYYIICDPQNKHFVYKELKDAPEEIKAMVMKSKKTSGYSSSSSTHTSKL